MKKILLVLVLLSFAGNSYAGSFFDDSKFGIALISQSVAYEIDDNGSVTRGTDSGIGLGFYLEKYYKRRYRLNGTFNYVSYDLYSIAGVTVSGDYLMPVNSTFTFFGGAALGGAMQKYNDSSLSDSSLGLVYGAQAGVIAYFNRRLMMELGYRYRPTKLETKIAGQTNSTSTIDDLSETYLSLIVKF